MKRKKGFIVRVRDLGTIWQMDIAERITKGEPKGKTTTISGDWRPMSEGLDDAFGGDILGQQIEYSPDSIFGAKSWEPTGIKKKLKGVV